MSGGSHANKIVFSTDVKNTYSVSSFSSRTDATSICFMTLKICLAAVIVQRRCSATEASSSSHSQESCKSSAESLSEAGIKNFSNQTEQVSYRETLSQIGKDVYSCVISLVIGLYYSKFSLSCHVLFYCINHYICVVYYQSHDWLDLK